MKTIGSFKLHKKGDDGISISSEQLSKSIADESNDKVYHDEINTFRKDFVPRHILDAINRLKFFYLNLTGHWIDLYDQYLDTETYLLEPVGEDAKAGRRHLQTLWESTWVTQAKIDGHSFSLIGMLEIVDGKMLNISPPKVTPDDDLDFYVNAREVIQGIVALLVQYFSTAAISDVDDYRKYLLSHADETAKVEIASFDESQIVNRVMDEMSKQGAIIMMEGDPALQPKAVEQIAEENKVIEEPKADFEPEPEDQGAYEAGVEEEIKSRKEELKMETGEDWDNEETAPEPEKVPDPYGQPAAEEGKAEAVDESMEFSDNVGQGDIGNEGQLDDVQDDEFT